MQLSVYLMRKQIYIPMNGACVRDCEFSLNYRANIAHWTIFPHVMMWLREGAYIFSHGYTLRRLAVLERFCWVTKLSVGLRNFFSEAVGCVSRQMQSLDISLRESVCAFYHAAEKDYVFDQLSAPGVLMLEYGVSDIPINLV